MEEELAAIDNYGNQMSTKNILLIIIAAIFCSCNQSGTSSSKRDHKPFVKISSYVDTSNTEIYEFLKTVIVKEELDTTYGLTAEPRRNLDAMPDSIFLKSFLIDKTRVKLKPNNVRTLEVSIKCLTEEDIQFMLDQKIKNQGFRWDSSRLSFSSTNLYAKSSKEYAFSIPLFSKDKTKVLISLDSYAQGGSIILFKKEKSNWTGQKIEQWIH